MKILEYRKVETEELYVFGKTLEQWLSIFILITLLLLALNKLASADTTTLNYSQCMTDNVSNQTYCAQEWFDLNITDVRMNATFYLMGPAQIYNETWNVTFNSTAPKYNTVLSPDFGANATHLQSNITCVGLQFPALNQNVSINGNQTWYPTDSRYNLTAYCVAPSQADCRENVDYTLDFGGDYYSSKCNIHLRSKPRPSVNETRTLLSGEAISNTDFGFYYSCQNTTPELMTCSSEKISQADVIRQMGDNATTCANTIQGVNSSLNGCLAGSAEKDKNITRSTELLTNVSENKASDNRDLLALGIIVAGIVIGVVGRDYMNKRNLPPVGGADPYSLELEERMKKERETTKSVINDLFDKHGKGAK